MEVFWAIFVLGAVAAAIIAIAKSYLVEAKAQGASDLIANQQISDVGRLDASMTAVERVTDTQTKRLNDHYSAIAGLRAESRRQRSEIRQLTRTVEALAASHGRHSSAIADARDSLRTMMGLLKLLKEEVGKK